MKNAKSMYFQQHLCGIVWLIMMLFFFQNCQQRQQPFDVQEQTDAIVIHTQNYKLHIRKAGFRYEFQHPDGTVIAAAHPESGLRIGKQGQPLANVVNTKLIRQEKDHLVFAVEAANGIRADIHLWPESHALKMQVLPKEEDSYTIVGRLQGLSPAYGLSDHAAFGHGTWDRSVRSKAELTGFEADSLVGYRMVSNFAIFPKQGFAEVNIEPGLKLVRFTKEENAQGSREVRSMPALYYFIGTPKQIYQAFLAARNKEGFPVYQPKYAWFGVGWEAFGALAWKTNQESVTQNINRYLQYGYPLQWMVLGSGFWPRGAGEFDQHGTPYGSESTSAAAKKLQATTSFGMWDKQLYPHPKEMIDYFHQQGLTFTIGLRIGFIPGGPFTDEGLKNNYFIENQEDSAQLFEVGFPRSKVYLLDAHKPEAVDWYVSLCHKWLAYGVDGFKEDLFGYPQWLPDDLIDPVNRALMDQGVYVMGRNNYLGSPVDIHRYNDFNYNQSQDRGPINGLAYAYSGFPYVYPDIVGGTGLATGRFGNEPENKLRVYLMRYAQYAAVNPSMSFGYGPWNFDEATNRICLQAARLHNRLQPYIYSYALKAYKTGFPYTLTPLPLAYPDDPEVYGLADTVRRSYQWLIGESLMAAPLYGDDYATANSRDVYLPKGKWMDYATGQLYEGPATLKNFALPVDKIPLFVGGKGILVEQEEQQKALKAVVYPVASANSVFEFTFPDGKTVSTIHNNLEDWDAGKLQVIDHTSKKTVACKKDKKTGAVSFELEPGHEYTLTN